METREAGNWQGAAGHGNSEAGLGATRSQRNNWSGRRDGQRKSTSGAEEQGGEEKEGTRIARLYVNV